MFKSTNTMIQILSTDAGFVLPMSTQIDRTSSQPQFNRWSNGLGGDIVATVISMAALLLIGFLA
jgi:hypothetical protein